MAVLRAVGGPRNECRRAVLPQGKGALVFIAEVVQWGVGWMPWEALQGGKDDSDLPQQTLLRHPWGRGGTTSCCRRCPRSFSFWEEPRKADGGPSARTQTQKTQHKRAFRCPLAKLQVVTGEAIVH